MSREIKFRAWDGSRIRSWEDITQTLGFNHFLWNKELEIELMQFTGLKDNIGKEIYEGDIVKSGMTGALYIIMFGEFSTKDSHGIGFWKKGINTTDRGITYDNTSNSVKGNIYQNPELIE